MATVTILDEDPCAVFPVEDPTHEIVIDLEVNDFRQALVRYDIFGFNPARL